MSPSNNKPLTLNKEDSSSSTSISNPSSSVTTTSTTTTSDSSMSTAHTQSSNTISFFKKSPESDLMDDVYCDTDLVFNTKTIVNDSLVGGQTQDQIHDETLNTLDNITLNSLNYNSMLSKMELNEHLKFDIKDTSLNDSLNADSLEDILCNDDENSLKATKMAQEKSIADFSLDFVDSNGLQLNQVLSNDDVINDAGGSNDVTIVNSGDGNSNNGMTTAQNGNVSGPPYNCDICSREFQNLEYLIRHLKKHSGEFTCSDCFMVSFL